MAQMLPQRLRLETKSDAERHLYHALQRSLPDDFVVFHSVRWLVPVSYTHLTLPTIYSV